MMSRRKRSRLPEAIILIFVITICLVGALSLWMVELLPRMAARDFGPATSTLSTSQKVVYAFRLEQQKQQLLNPVNPKGPSAPFEVTLGESVDSIAARLQAQGLIQSAAAFTDFLVYAGLDTAVQAGKYEISPAQNSVEIARSLLDATPRVITFNILAGWRMEEVAAALPTSGLRIQPYEFLDAARDSRFFPPWWEGASTLEGFFFPGSYELDRNMSVDQLVPVLVSRFDQEIGPELRDIYSQQGLTLTEAVTLASIIEREAVDDSEMPMIASVFFNRLAAGMRLESDPTAQYAVGFNQEQQTWWTNPLSLDDIGTVSPYNTYVTGGLPPGPICNPGLNAMQAVAHPADTPYFYFRARCDGSGLHEFAVTYDEHLQNACP